jgi:hypothetical protein
VGRVLGEDDAAVGDHVERAALTGEKLGFDAEGAGNRSRQPGGLWTVVSADAVLDLDRHDGSIIRPIQGAGRSAMSATIASSAVIHQIMAMLAIMAIVAMPI